MDMDVVEMKRERETDGETDFTAFAQRVRVTMFGVARRIVGNPATAEDITQDVLLRVWRHWYGVDGTDDRRSVATWPWIEQRRYTLCLTTRLAIDWKRCKNRGAGAVCFTQLRAGFVTTRRGGDELDGGDEWLDFLSREPVAGVSVVAHTRPDTLPERVVVAREALTALAVTLQARPGPAGALERYLVGRLLQGYNGREAMHLAAATGDFQMPGGHGGKMMLCRLRKILRLALATLADESEQDDETGDETESEEQEDEYVVA